MDDQALQGKLDQLKMMAEASSSDGMYGAAIEACQEAIQLLEMTDAEDPDHRDTDFRLMMADTYWASGDIEEALRQYQNAAIADPDSLDADAAVGFTLFHLCRFSAARSHLERLSAEASEMPDVWYYLGLCAQRVGDTGLETYAFQKAFALDPEQYPLSVRVSRKEIEELLVSMIDQLPAPLAEALVNVPILLEDLPSDDILFSEDPPLDPLTLGLFVGTPVTEESVFNQPADLTRILLFRKNIERVAADREKLEEELWITLKHEIGHYWGLDEEELAEMGLE